MNNVLCLNGSQMSWRIEDYFDNNSECEMFIYAMHGIYSDTFDPSFDEKTISKYFSHPEWSARIKELLDVSLLYKQISEISKKFTLEFNEFLSLIGQLLKKFLEKTYLKDLCEIEQSFSINICHFNILLKYKQIFQDILSLIKRIECNNECSIFSKLRIFLESKCESELSISTDVFLQMSAQYMLYGSVSSLSSSSFFINNVKSDQTTIDFTKWPEIVNHKNAMIIQETGQFVRTLRSLGIIHDLNEHDIFQDCHIDSQKFYRYPVLFDDFMNVVQKRIRLEHLQDFSAQTLSDVLRNFHLFSLHRHEYFWFNFFDQREVSLCTISSNEKSNTMAKIFRSTLFLTYNYEDANDFEENITLISNQNKDELVLVKLMFELPPIAQLWLHRSHKKKYQTVFVYLTKLLQTRFAIMKAWKLKSKVFSQRAQIFLLHWSFKTLGSFYSYSKFCIENRMTMFTKGCMATMNIEEICEHHERILIQLTEDLYLNTKMFSNLINDIINFSFELIKSNCNSIQISTIERFKCIRSTVKRIFHENCDYRLKNRFHELLRFD